VSEYVTITTIIQDADSLVAALANLGIPPEAIERHQEPVPLFGWQGDPRPERAEIVIRRRWVGTHSNDIGFARQPDGTWRALISEYDQRHAGRWGPYDQAWLGRLSQAYALHHLSRAYQARGWRVAAQRNADGTITLTAER
jgi:hypothetical protein